MTDCACICPLPSPTPAAEQVSQTPGLGTAGSFNATLHFEASLRGGQPSISPLAYMYDESSTPYMYQTYPEVASVTPANGSTAGGTLVTITGRGFPDLSLGLGHKLDVSMGGSPCTVLTSTYTTITCRTSPQPASAVAAES